MLGENLVKILTLRVIPRRGKNSRKGFTLIEIMIAIFLIGVALVGALAFFNSSLTSNFDAKNELIAAGLAQEGAELVRNLADYKKLHDGATWSDLTNASTGFPACSRIDYQSLTSHGCQNAAIDEICFSGNGRYFQCPPSGTGVGMQRTLSITCEDSNNNPTNCNTPINVKNLIIVSRVIWNDRTTTATDRLYENNY
jgi:prepilin-type N-terminal cleavage/methylation domain-containing protein